MFLSDSGEHREEVGYRMKGVRGTDPARCRGSRPQPHRTSPTEQRKGSGKTNLEVCK